MIIESASFEDFARIREIYASARQFMAENGNSHQWGDDKYPNDEIILSDIAENRLFTARDGQNIEGVFTAEKGPDKLYGDSVATTDYCTVHRVASSGKVKGILSSAVNFAAERFRSNYVFMDTHSDNIIMQKALLKLGFEYIKTADIEAMPERFEPRMIYRLRVKGYNYDRRTTSATQRKINEASTASGCVYYALEKR